MACVNKEVCDFCDARCGTGYYAHWIGINPKKDVEGWIECDYKCSACDEISWEEHNYCPNCGAKMEEKVEYADA